ncbi:MAG: hypothetical protein JNM50_05940 [Chromatiales bacterium]|nr:hypothetical protein [Chromatiales bacterium]
MAAAACAGLVSARDGAGSAVVSPPDPAVAGGDGPATRAPSRLMVLAAPVVIRSG